MPKVIFIIYGITFFWQLLWALFQDPHGVGGLYYIFGAFPAAILAFPWSIIAAPFITIFMDEGMCFILQSESSIGCFILAQSLFASVMIFNARFLASFFTRRKQKSAQELEDEK